MRVKLEEVCSRGSSNLMKKEVASMDGKYPIYGASGQIGTANFYHQEKPYVAVVKDGAGIGRTMLLPAYSSVIGTLQYLIPKHNVLPDYLCYVVQYMNLAKYSSGATIPHIYFRDYKNEEFNLASVDRQQEIVTTLNKIQRIITCRRTQLSKLDELIKCRFMEQFGGPGIQSRYPTVTLGSISNMISGGTPSSKHPEYFGGNIPFVSTPCLGPNFIDASAAQNWLTELGVQMSSTHIVPANSLMVGNRVGVGKSSINTCEMCTNQDILSFVDINTDKFDLLFVKKVIEQYGPIFESQKRGATIKGVPSDLVKASQIPQVPIDVQRAFVGFVRQTDKFKFAYLLLSAYHRGTKCENHFVFFIPFVREKGFIFSPAAF